MHRRALGIQRDPRARTALATSELRFRHRDRAIPAGRPRCLRWPVAGGNGWLAATPRWEAPMHLRDSARGLLSPALGNQQVRRRCSGRRLDDRLTGFGSSSERRRRLNAAGHRSPADDGPCRRPAPACRRVARAAKRGSRRGRWFAPQATARQIGARLSLTYPAALCQGLILCASGLRHRFGGAWASWVGRIVCARAPMLTSVLDPRVGSGAGDKMLMGCCSRWGKRCGRSIFLGSPRERVGSSRSGAGRGASV